MMLEKAYSFLRSINFSEPDKLQLLAVPLALFILVSIFWPLWLYRRPKKTYGSRYPFFGSFVGWSFLTVCLACLIIVLAKPFLAAGNVIVERGNVEVIFIVDYSSSMLLKDTGMARIDIASREMTKLLSFGILRKGDKAALFVLGLKGMRYLPLTSDLDNFGEEVSKLGLPANLMGSNIYWGSDIGATLEKVYTSLDRQDAFFKFKGKDPPPSWRPEIKQNRLVVFIGDGDYFNYENDEKEIEEDDKKYFESGLNEFRKRGLKIYPIGIGTRAGAKVIDILKDYKVESEYDSKLVEDLEGQYSRLSAYSLEYMRNATGAEKLFLMENSDADASDFLRTVINNPIYRSISVEPGINQEKQELWLYFTFLALGFMGLAIKFF